MSKTAPNTPKHIGMELCIILAPEALLNRQTCQRKNIPVTSFYDYETSIIIDDAAVKIRK